MEGSEEEGLGGKASGGTLLAFGHAGKGKSGMKSRDTSPSCLLVCVFPGFLCPCRC
jgi:hypothetical protein